jgi:hypothetical protein
MENLYHKDYEYGSINLSWKNDLFTLETRERNEDGFLDICILTFTTEEMEAEEVLFVLERQKLNGRYHDFFHTLCLEGQLDLVNYKSYFRNNELCFEYEYKFAA